MMQRPKWLPAYLWHRLNKGYPKLKAPPAVEVGDVRRVPSQWQPGHYSQWGLEEVFGPSATVSPDGVTLAWETGTEKRGNDWDFYLTEAQLLAMLEAIRQARVATNLRAEWRENGRGDVLESLLNQASTPSGAAFQRAERLLDELDNALSQKALGLTKKKPVAKKKKVARRS